MMVDSSLLLHQKYMLVQKGKEALLPCYGGVEEIIECSFTTWQQFNKLQVSNVSKPAG